MKMDFNNFKRILFSKKEDLSTIDRFKRFKYDYYLIICGLFIISTIIAFYLSKNIISIILLIVVIFLVLMFFSSRIILSYYRGKNINIEEFTEKMHYISLFLFIGFIVLVKVFKW